MDKRNTAKVSTIPVPVIHVFKESRSHSTVSHYALVELIGKSSLLTDEISISRNRNFEQPDSEFYLSPKEEGNWPTLSELHMIAGKNVLIGYRGQDNKKEDTILVEFNDQNNTVKIIYFENYYSKDISPLLPFLKKSYQNEKGEKLFSFKIFKCSRYSSDKIFLR